LGKKKRKLLEDKEVVWRLKIHVIWMEKGDENKKFFQAYVKGRKIYNTIWNLKNIQGNEVPTFEGLARMGMMHFSSLFKVDSHFSMAEIVCLVGFFPGFVNEYDNRRLMEEVIVDEVKEVLHGFQKDKSPGPNGWTIEFFLGLFDLIGKDILEVIEESRSYGHIYPPLNSTFVALIPKTDIPQSFEDFRPISLCNVIYKVIAKIIAKRIKPFLSTSISKE
jgi:hypothetical protein